MTVYPRVRKTLTVRTRRRGSGRVRAENNFPAREAEATERARDRLRPDSRPEGLHYTKLENAGADTTHMSNPLYGTEIDSPATAGVWTGRRRACVACSKL